MKVMRAAFRAKFELPPRSMRMDIATSIIAAVTHFPIVIGVV
jgi:hypothetical protein